MQSLRRNGVIFLAVLVLSMSPTALGARLKDIASLKGARTNQLVGYGLVVGLNGTGDGTGTKFTVQSLVNMMERMGVHVLKDQVKIANVAAVMVTANLQPFARIGSKTDVLISSIGDAKSLQGGTLLMTPLRGVDNQIYALCQGPLVVGGFASSGAAGGGVSKNHPTVANIPNGALIEKEIPFDLQQMDDLVIALHQPDFTTAKRVAEAIKLHFQELSPVAGDAGTIRINLTEKDKERLVGMVASLEQLEIVPDNKAKVVLNERTGTVVIGENVRIDAVAIAHGNLSVQIKESQNVSQPSPLSSGGQTVATPESQVDVKEEDRRLIMMPGGATLGDLVKALNAVGVAPRDLITVFQAIKAAGALQAELEIF